MAKVGSVSLTFLIRPIIQGVINGTYRFYVIIDDNELLVTSEVFESKEATVEAARTLIANARDLQVPFQMNFGAHSDGYLARIMNFETHAFVARTEYFDQPEGAEAAVQRFVNEVHAIGNDAFDFVVED